MLEISLVEFVSDLTNPALAFLPKALLMAVLTAAVGAVVGTHVVLRGMAFIGDAVAHAVFPGIAVAFLLQGSVLLGGAVSGAVVAVLVAVTSQRRRVREDSAIGVFFAAAFALGVVIISRTRGYTANLTTFLFGSITGVTTADLWITAAVGAAVVVTLLALGPYLVAVSLDRETARAMNLPVLALDLVLYLAVTAAVVISVRSIGNILVLALLITPAATARMLTRRLASMMALACAIGVVGAAAGIYVSWSADLPAGATIVLVLTAFFVVTWLARGLWPVDGTAAFRRPVGRRPRARGGERAGRGSRPAAVAASAVAACLTLGATVLVAPAPAVAAEDAAGEDPSSEETPAHAAKTHRPGEPGHSVDVAEDTTYETVDGTTEPHPCAGRRLLYRSHIDALYATRDRDKKLTMAVVNGQQVEPAEESCLRLAPDADNSGKEVSRFRLPDNPALSFLGKPGDVFWIGPQQMPFSQDWRPLWAGIGAFDPAHEFEVPKDFENNEVTFELTDFSGPEGGQVHNFFGRFGDKEMERTFGAPEGPKSFTAGVGSHGHYNWTFTEPGIYSFTWRARGRHTDGTEEVSEEVTQTWLVGSDEQVGLPEGTTTGLNEITEPVEPEATDPTPGEKPGSGGTSSPETSAPGRPGDSDSPADRRHPISSGHMDLALGAKDGRPFVYLKDQEDVTNEQKRKSGTFTFLVPDAARGDLGGQISGIDGKVWVLPDVQKPNLPWVGFSTTDAGKAVSDSDPVTVRIADFKGPGRMVTAHSGLTGSKVVLDSDDKNSSVTYGAGAHDHQAFVFTEPGNYTVTFEFTGKFAGQDLDERLEAHFAVGADDGTGENPANDPESENGVEEVANTGGLKKAFASLNKAIEKLGRALTKALRTVIGSGPGDTGRDGAAKTRPTSKPKESVPDTGEGNALGETATPTPGSDAGTGSTGGTDGGHSNGSDGKSAAGDSKSPAESGKSISGGESSAGGGSAQANGKSAGSGTSGSQSGEQAKSAAKGSGAKSDKSPAQAKSSRSGKSAKSGKSSTSAKSSKANGSAGGIRRLSKDGASGEQENEENDAHAIRADGADRQPGDAETGTAATGSVGTPDWWSGLVLGLGIAALIAGLIMLFNARRTVRVARERDADTARGASRGPGSAG